MTKAQLIDYAKENGISGVTTSKTKAQILGILRG